MTAARDRIAEALALAASLEGQAQARHAAADALGADLGALDRRRAAAALAAWDAGRAYATADDDRRETELRAAIRHECAEGNALADRAAVIRRAAERARAAESEPRGTDR